MTVAPREQLPTLRGRQTQAAIDAAARIVIARKGILATTISDIAAEAGRSTASFYNYYDSKEAMVREWAVRFRDEARERARAAAEPGLTTRSAPTGGRRALEHLPSPTGRDDQRLTARHDQRRLRRVLGRDLRTADLADHRDGETGSAARASAPDDDPHLVAVAMVSMLNQFCYTQLCGDAAAATVDDEACITTLANVFYRTIYHKEAGLT